MHSSSYILPVCYTCMRRQNMYHQWTWDFKLSDTCKNASQKKKKKKKKQHAQKEVKEVTVREFIYSELRLYCTQSTFRMCFSFPMVHKMRRLFHTRYSGLIFGVFLRDGLSRKWLSSPNLPR